MRCRDCAWFNRSIGRDPVSCRDLGEEPDNEACLQFEVDVPEPEVKPPAEYIGALRNQSYRDIFHEVIAESFVLEQDAHLAIATIRAQLQSQGANITIDGAKFERQKNRVVDLYVLHRLVMALGLTRYADDIMKAEIANMYTSDKSSNQRLITK